MQGFETRKAALSLLTGIMVKGEPLERLLDSDPNLKGLSPRDRSFTRALVSTTLRHIGSIDWTVNTVMDRPLKDTAARPRNILRLAVAQLFYLNVPDHAAVDTAVRQAEAHRSSKPFKGLINAVLRRIIRERKELEAKANERGNTPPWLYRSWQKDWGKRAPEKMAAVHLTGAPLDLSFKDTASVKTWARRLGGKVLPTGSVRLQEAGPVPEIEGFEAGEWWVQDAAAAIPAMLFDIKPGDRALDLCAAPGGKTARLAASGAKVTALDKSISRLERLSENLARLDLTCEALAADAGSWTPSEPFPHVLLDAPCSATGTIRRHPDVPHLKSRKEIEDLTKIQTRLLDAAADMTAQGGTLIYCTCSLEKSEGERQIESFLERHPEFERSPIAIDEVGGEETIINDRGELRILPFLWSDQGGIDGFFAARLTKV